MSSIGEVLSDSRRNIGKSIKDVEKATKIRSKYIEALENDDFSQIPGDIYVKGFIRTYSDYLGLDSEILVKQYRLEHHPVAQPEPAAARPTVTLGPKSRRRGGRVAVIGAAVSGVFIVLLLWGMLIGRRPAGVQVRSAGELAGPAAGTRKIKTAAKSQSGAAVADEWLTVTVHAASQPCWLRAVGDRRHMLFEQVLRAGETRTWAARRTIQLEAGNPSGLMVWVDGVYRGVMDASGGNPKRVYSLN